MNTRQIICTLELAKTRNFNRAAENLFITQPALSYQIKSLEAEVGFTIFERSGKGTDLTLAGQTFCERLIHLKQDLLETIEHCQNLNQTYDDVIKICVPFRTAIQFLSEAITIFHSTHPKIFIEVTIDAHPNQYQHFLQGKYDLFYAIKSNITPQKDIENIFLYNSRIYLVVNSDDPLSQLESATSQHLIDRTLIVGGGSPKELKNLQQKIISQLHLSPLTSANHETTLINIAAKRGICLIPGLLNDFNTDFAWIPFSSSTDIPCVLCKHKHNHKKNVLDFLKLLQTMYYQYDEFDYMKQRM